MWKNREKRLEYAKQYNKEWYQKNKDKRSVELKAEKNKNKEFILSLKIKCNRCPETHTSCLEFHHIDPNEKELEIAKVVQMGWGKKRILEEINKCELLCSNCHRKEHYKN